MVLQQILDILERIEGPKAEISLIREYFNALGLCYPFLSSDALRAFQ